MWLLPWEEDLYVLNTERIPIIWSVTPESIAHKGLDEDADTMWANHPVYVAMPVDDEVVKTFNACNFYWSIDSSLQKYSPQFICLAPLLDFCISLTKLSRSPYQTAAVLSSVTIFPTMSTMQLICTNASLYTVSSSFSTYTATLASMGPPPPWHPPLLDTKADRLSCLLLPKEVQTLSQLMGEGS